MKYKAFTINNISSIPQFDKFSKELLYDFSVVSKIFPFKVSNYVTDELINWDNLENDPIFKLTFPQKGMLSEEHFKLIEETLKHNTNEEVRKKIFNDIRLQLNPHPDNQMSMNIPRQNGILLNGLQHKYLETVLFFPNHGQTCHSYCTFCFRWAQFIGIDNLKMAMKESSLLYTYLQNNLNVTDLLFTGGDPMVMSTEILKKYLTPIIDGGNTNIQTIRFGTKALAFWPQRFLTDKDSCELLNTFEKIVKKGFNLIIVAHFSHHIELETEHVKNAIRQIRNTGAQIFTQSPILKGINDNSQIWAKMWRSQVNLNCIPYYMFIPRDTGASTNFEMTLEDSWKIFNQAYCNISGICKTVKGPVMSTSEGKVQILGLSKINNNDVFVLQYVQARNAELVGKPFFAKYNKLAKWITDLQPFESDLDL